jgi:hypothetical protein
MKKFILSLFLILVLVSGSQAATFTQTISDGANSCYWRNFPLQADFNTNSIHSGNYFVAAVDYYYYSSLLFTNVTVPKGATIISAVLSINVQSAQGSYPLIHLLVKGEAADSPAAPTTAADGDGRVRTTASVDPTFINTGNKDIDVSGVVAEIFARSGWASGNNLQLFIDDNGSDTGQSNWIIAGAVATYARTLTIVYTSGWSGKIMGVTNPAKVMGIPKANIKTVMGK